MVRSSEKQPTSGKLDPRAAFVIQLRSDSDLSRGRFRGRVEHVVTGDSEPFTSLETLVAFMARYASGEKA